MIEVTAGELFNPITHTSHTAKAAKSATPTPAKIFDHGEGLTA